MDRQEVAQHGEGNGQGNLLDGQFEEEEPEELLEWVFRRFGARRVGLVTSFQAEGMVLLDMAWRIRPDVRVITIDTGRLPEATYAFMERVREHYGIGIEVVQPEGRLVEQMVNRHGVNLFFRDVNLRLLCCHVRKVLPLRRILGELDAWVTGLRRQQAATRANVPKVAVDPDHGGVLKLNPLADWEEERVWAYVRERGVPCHPFYEQGYASLGCEPCTRPVAPGEGPRSGRWWWEKGVPKECGMHCSLEAGGFPGDLERSLEGPSREGLPVPGAGLP